MEKLTITKIICKTQIGTSIQDATKEALLLSLEKDVPVEFSFSTTSHIVSLEMVVSVLQNQASACVAEPPSLRTPKPLQRG